jgi:hypothetical protein
MPNSETIGLPTAIMAYAAGMSLPLDLQVGTLRCHPVSPDCLLGFSITIRTYGSHYYHPRLP